MPKGVAQAQKIEPLYNFEPPRSDGTQRIVAFSGKIGAGKTSCCNFIHALAFTHLLGITPYAFVADNGRLIVQDRDNVLVEYDLDDKSPLRLEQLSTEVWPYIRKFSVSESLKQFCITFLGLKPENVFGTQAQKNELTHLKWENVPGKHSKKGYMTNRECLEHWGTEIIRKAYEPAHANAFISNILESKIPYVVCDDLRFPNELELLQKVGGKAIRLTLETEEAKQNTHESNVALDNSLDKFDAIIDNAGLTMDQSFSELMKLLIEWGWFSQVN